MWYKIASWVRSADERVQSLFVSDDGLVDLNEAGVERLEELGGVNEISNTSGLANGVHGELGDANVDATHSEFGGKNGANGGSAEGIVTDYESLGGNISDSGESLGDVLGLDGGSVTGIAVLLDDGTVVEEGRVVGLVLAAVVGVEGVGHVAGEEEGAADGEGQREVLLSLLE